MPAVPDTTTVHVDLSEEEASFESVERFRLNGLACQFYYGEDENGYDMPYAAIGNVDTDGELIYPWFFAPRQHIVELARKIIELSDSEKDVR